MPRSRFTISFLCFVLTLGTVSCGGGGGGEPEPGNEAPMASDGTLETALNTPADGVLEATDPDGDALTYTIVEDGTLGSAVITDESTGAFTYTPNADATGEDTFVFVANDGTEDSNTATVTVTIAVPVTATATIATAGGRGGSNGGTGGPGGPIDIFKQTGSGNIEVRGDGVVDASFTPATPTPNLGDNPLTITSDTAIDVAPTEPPAGTPYFVSNQPQVFVSNGNGMIGDESPVTGISVAADTMLTLGLASNGNTVARIVLEGDFLNQGAVMTQDIDTGRRGDVVLEVSSYIGDGDIRTSGMSDGQTGGRVTIAARFSIVNQGGLDTRGADSALAPGGRGGDVLFSAQGGLDNTGDVDASGGSSGTVDPGFAGQVILQARRGIRNAGNLTARGGDGSYGGFGGTVLMETPGPSGEAADILNAGNIDTRGGVGATGRGGDGGPVLLRLYGRNLRSSGDIDTRGGDSSSDLDSGGNGGVVDMRIEHGGSGPSGDVSIGDLEVSGNIDISGGDAVPDGQGNGGGGGVLVLNTNRSFMTSADRQQRIVLLGYSAIDTRGGMGNFGGPAGSVIMENTPSNGPFGQVPSGGVINDADLNVRGGDVVPDASVMPALGGCAGTVVMGTQFDPQAAANPNDVSVENGGDITSGSGNSLNALGPNFCGSTVELRGFDGVANSGDIDNSGGSDASDDGDTNARGDDGGSIVFRSSGPIINSGTLAANGGDGEYAGGFAREIVMFGSEVTNSGPISCSGGHANPKLSGSLGGNGGTVELRGGGGLGSVDNDAAVSINGGTGEMSGQDGRFIEDGFCVAGQC